MYINVFYHNYINVIGGIETFLYELAKLSYENHRDLTIVYGAGDKKQIARLSRYCRTVALKDMEKPIKCKRAFFNYDTGCIDDFEAEEYYQIVHADFKSPILSDWIKQHKYSHNKITHYKAVSHNNIKSFKELTGIDAEILYNPITIEKEPRIMTLVSATRLSAEKGGDRMVAMIKELDAKKIPYIWHIFSAERLPIKSDNVMYHAPTLDVRKWLKYGDYVVQLSDTEGFPYTPYESLCLGTPLIITKLPILSDLGVNEKNAIVVDFDLHDLDVEAIYKKAGKFKFKYEPKGNDAWLNLLQGESNYKCDFVTVEADVDFYDTVLGEDIKKGQIYTTTKERGELIASKSFGHIL